MLTKERLKHEFLGVISETWRQAATNAELLATRLEAEQARIAPAEACRILADLYRQTADNLDET